MADVIKVTVKDAKLQIFKLRSRFLKLQRTVISEALLEASQPIVTTAQALAPVLSTPKRGRQPGQLRGRIGPTLLKRRGGGAAVAIGAVRFSKSDKQFPFWDRFQERGFRATGRATRKTAKRFTVVAGKNFLKRAGEQNFAKVEQIFAARLLKRFEEIQDAGIAAGLV